MNIDKALEILIIHNDHNPNFTDGQRNEAHRLGIEALKAVKHARANDYYSPGRQTSWIPPLPGETKD